MLCHPWSLRAPLLLGALALVAACDNGSKCDEEKIAIELQLIVPDGTSIEKVTVELKDEQECGTVYDPAMGKLYTCWEQGGGTYTLRVYSAGQVIHTQEVELESDGCHIKERLMTEIDLTI